MTLVLIMTIIPGEPGWEQDDNKPEGNQGRGEGCHRGKFFSFSFGPIFSGSVLVVSYDEKIFD